MPYCSIEEAWGKDFFENEAEPEKFKKIVSDDYYNNDEDYFNNNYKDSNVYNELEDNLFCPENKINKIKKKKKFSRTYNRLSEHSGPETRLPYMNRHVINNKKNLKIYPEEENNLISEEENDSKSEEENDENSISYDDKIIKEAFNNQFSKKDKDKYINNLIKENIKLKNILKKYDTNGIEYDNIFDLILFLSFGVFIILLLDIISKSIRRVTF